MDAPNRTALILYGTETGTAQDLAHELSRTLTRLHFSTVDVIGLDDLPHVTSLHHYALSVFVIATTGQGDFPDNARLFWKRLLRKKLGPTTLRGVRYALVGLGDSSYLKFNWAGRKLGKRLSQLGAKEVVASCEADEQGDEGIDGFYLEWVKGFRETVLEAWPLPEGSEVMSEDTPVPDRWRLCRADEEMHGDSRNGDYGSMASATPQTAGSFPAVLEINDRATPKEHWQDVRLLKLIAPGRHEYLPGDALAVMPENDPNDVEILINHMSWQSIADSPIRLVHTTPPNPDHPTPSFSRPPVSLPPSTTTTLRALLTSHLDISGIPRRSFFATMSKYTSNAMHKDRILEFTDPQYLDEYFDYATRPRRGIIEVLQEFDSVQIPWQECINVFPVLRPRQFSIASAYPQHNSNAAADSNTGDKTVFELLVAIVKYKTVLKRIRQGVCTRYLARLPIGTQLQVALRTEGRIATRKDLSSRNHILIGAGTGIAPLRSLVLAKRDAAAAALDQSDSLTSSPSQAQSSPTGRNTSTTTLIFGARNQAADFFFAEDWAALTKGPSSTISTPTPTTTPSPSASPWPFSINLITAFSRDQPRKIYVQDRIREHACVLAPLMHGKDTVVVVCGASGMMPKAVRAALADALVAAVPWEDAQQNPGRNGFMEEGGKEEEKRRSEAVAEAEAFLAQTEREGRYKQETWS